MTVKPGTQTEKQAKRRWILFSVAFCFLSLLGTGCASIRDTEFSVLVPPSRPEPWRIAVLVPEVTPALRPENVKSEGAWYEFLLGGRGTVVTGSDLSREVGLALIATLTQAEKYQRVFPVNSEAQARELRADRILSCRVYDCRTILQGANLRYLWTVPLGFPQYLVRCLTLEARLDWDVQMFNLTDGTEVFHRRLQRSYYKTVRSVLPYKLIDKMLTFLQYEAVPEYVVELFLLDTAVPAEAAVQP